MNVLDFVDAIDAANLAPVYLFCPGKAPRGKATTFEPFLADRAVEALVNAAVDPETRDMAMVTFHGDETDVRTVVNEAETLPFLAARRVVLVRQAERYQSESGKALHAYLENPNQSTTLILLAGKADKRTKFYKNCDKSGMIVECPALNDRDAMKWLRQEVRARARKIEDSAVQEIVGRSGARLSDVNNALTLVLNFIGENEEPITEEAVRAACADVAEEEIWTLTDTIAASRTGDALTALRRLVELGKHPDEIIGTINWLLRMAYSVAATDSGQAISPYQAQKVEPLARKLGVRKLRSAFALCTDAQFAMRNTGSNPLLIVEMLVVKLAYPKNRAA